MTNSKRIAFYLRSATGNLADLKRQLNTLNKAMLRRGFDPDAYLIEVYRDAHHSGLRPGLELERMSRDVKDGKINVIMVSRMNRISRATNGLFNFLKFVETHRIRFISANENCDSIYWHSMRTHASDGAL